MRLARRLLIICVVAGFVALSMQWLLDVPAQYPDHGLEALDRSLMPVAVCLIEEIGTDPAAFGVGRDFRLSIDESDAFKVHGWMRSSTVIFFDDVTLTVESDTNPLADPERISTMCGTL